MKSFCLFAAAVLSGILLLPLSALPGSASDCSRTSVGLTPLSDLGAATYQGFPGGLYPDGANTPPPAHEQAGLAQALQVAPLDAGGIPSPQGRIVLLTIGMSNTMRESDALITLAAGDPYRNPDVMIVNGAQGGQTAAIISDPGAPYWQVVDQRLVQQGLTPLQVQAIWFMEANANPTDPFPQHADTLRAQFGRILRIIRSRYPNARLCYASSRIYAGYATTPLNPEPWAYESGFAVKWLIEDQIAGDPELNFDPSHGPVVAPWTAWAAYLWADGLRPRGGDSLTWQCSDFDADGTHPSAQGSEKVAHLLLHFLHSDSTASIWYVQDAPADVPPASGSGRGGEDPRLWPNPSTGRISIRCSLPHASRLRLEVFRPSGSLVRSEERPCTSAGPAVIHCLDPREDEGPLPSGTYLLRLRADGRTVGAWKVLRLR